MIRAPNWLQVVMIVLLLSAAVYGFWSGDSLLGICFAIGGGTLCIAFILRRMMQDDYGRT